jgi:hypothetical protein
VLAVLGLLGADDRGGDAGQGARRPSTWTRSAGSATTSGWRTACTCRTRR